LTKEIRRLADSLKVGDCVIEKNSRVYLTLLSTSHGMNHFYQLLVPVVIPKITAEYKLSNFTAGVLLSWFSLSYALLQTPSGYLSKFISRKNLVILGFVITSASFLIIGFINNIIIFALLLFLAGIGGSTYHPNGIPLLAEVYKENMGQASGFHQTGGAFGSFIAPLIVGVLVLNINWRLTITWLSVPGIILSIILWLLLVNPYQQVKEKPERQTDGNRVNRTKLYGPALILIAASVVYTVGLRGVNSFANQYFTYGRGIQDIAMASFYFSMLQVAGLFSGPLSGKLSDTFGRKKVLTILIVVESVSLYALTMAPISTIIIPCIFFGVASFGMLAVTDAFMADITPRENTEAIFGLLYTTSFLTSVIIAPVLGSIADSYGFNTGFIILSAITPLSIPILVKVKTGKSQQRLDSLKYFPSK
jgi:FSR family fosmidomycin resistance protein-like MFS transporter